MRIDVISIFPEFFEGPFSASLLGKAVESGTVELHVHDLRQWTDDRHRTVDDTPYGGGAGMVMRPDVWFRAAEAVWGDDAPQGVDGPHPRTIVLTPRGRRLDQDLARELAAEPRLVLCCGRYEGIDERVHEVVATDEISVGDYVLAGGEVAAAVIVEAVTRLVPGVVGNEASTEDESFRDGLLEYPQYTRPAEIDGHHVPDVLLSGDHGAIAAWRREQAEAATRRLRPDLWDRRDAGSDDATAPSGDV
jgi:tRNA (guanine37-N1)-methyltransferase